MTQSGEVINQALLELIIKIGNSNNNNREDLQSSVKNEEVATVPQLDSLNENESTDNQKKLEDSSKIATKEEFHIDIRNLILILVSHIQHNSEPTRLAVLYWISHILANIPDQVSPYIAELFPVLLNALSDSSEEVVLFDIRVLAQIAKINNAHLETLISNLVELFKSNFYLHFLLSENAKVKMDTKINSSSPAGNDKQKISTNASSKLTQTSKLNNLKDEKSSNFFDNRCSFIIRKLCLFTSPLNTYSQFSNILSSLAENDHNNLPPNSINVGINVMKKYRIQENKIQNLRFISKMVDLLNSILMTSSELFELRNQLKNIQSNKNVELFHNLYKLWCYNPIATLALCMLTQNFNHSYRLLQSFVDINITIDFLTEIDKLIQLLESPVFMFLRLKLLEPERNGDLVKTLYGILMILPQSQAFHLLNSRLKCLPHLFCHATQIDHLTRESTRTFDTQNDSLKRSAIKINGSSNEKDAKIGDNSSVGKSSEDILDYDRLLEHFKRVQSQYMTLL